MGLDLVGEGEEREVDPAVSEGVGVAEVGVAELDVAFFRTLGPHTGPFSAGFRKSFGMQLLSKPFKGGQFSLALLQHQSLPSKQNPTDTNAHKVGFKGSHGNHRPRNN